MKVSDFIAKFLENNNIRFAYGMSGGAIIHLVDSIYHKTSIEIIFGTNEQFSAFEADGNARSNNCDIPGVCFSTSGPGATNLLTGIATSYFDSIPLLVFTGQVARHRQKGELQIRQYGFQELSIEDMAKHICKKTYSPSTIEELPLVLKDAWETSLSGRKGPVLIDLADDFQRDDISIEKMPKVERIFSKNKNVKSFCLDLLETLSKSKSPLILLGNGARESKKIIADLIKKLNIPTISTWASIDLVSDCEQYYGTVGTYSPKNNIFFNHSDLVLVIGCRLSNNIVGSIGKEFSPKSKKFIIDIDGGELEKLERVGILNYKSLNSDATVFSTQFYKILQAKQFKTDFKNWPANINEISQYREQEIFINDDILLLEKALIEVIKRNLFKAIFIDTGNNLAWGCNILSTLKSICPIFSSWNNTPMGYALPGAIGFSKGSNNSPICVLIGDGGLSLCLSEIAVVKTLNLPLMIIIVENGGHNIQKQTIETWLGGKFAGVNKESNLCLPDFENLGLFFGIESIVLDSENYEEAINSIKKWEAKKPIIIRIIIPEKARSFPIVPFGKKLSSPIN
tara:strand:- start:2600 stop:4306 length:1707 start_codon:yes stop_codon:yes gene_type:complete